MASKYEKRELTVGQLAEIFGVSRIGGQKRLEKWLQEGFPKGWSSDKFGGRHRIWGLFEGGKPVFLESGKATEFPPRRKLTADV
jgi:hypothetical protein